MASSLTAAGPSGSASKNHGRNPARNIKHNGFLVQKSRKDMARTHKSSTAIVLKGGTFAVGWQIAGEEAREAHRSRATALDLFFEAIKLYPNSSRLELVFFSLGNHYDPPSTPQATRAVLFRHSKVSNSTFGYKIQWQNIYHLCPLGQTGPS